MSEIKVSVIVPVYNVEMYIKRCLDSLVAQTLEEIQIILVDDGSDDGSGDICDDYAEKNSNIEVIHQENRGTGCARKTGLDACIGEYIAFVDPDDWVDAIMCQKLYEAAKSSNAKLIICDFNIVQGQNIEYMRGYHSNKVSIEDFYLSLTPGYVWNKLFHSSLKQEMKIDIKTSQAEDICMLLTLVSRLEHDTDIMYLPNAYYFYFQRDISMSRSDYFVKSYGIEEYLRSIKYILDNHDVRYQKYVVYYCVQCMYWGINNPERSCFKANYVEFIQNELYPYIKGNPYLKKYTGLMDDLLRTLIPKTLVYFKFSQVESKSEERFCMDSWKYYCRDYEIICLDESNCLIENAPACVQKAYAEKRYSFVGEYFQTKYVYQHGGIAISKKVRINQALGEQRLHKVFFGYVDGRRLGSDIWGSLPKERLLKMMLDTYKRDDIFNDAYMPLADRVQLLLEKEYKLIPKGKECYLMGNLVKLYSKETLYQRNSEKNVSQYYDELDERAQERNKVLIDRKELTELLSRLKNKDETIKSLEKKSSSIKKMQEDKILRSLEEELKSAKECANINKEAYELVVNSTFWKMTKPFRKILDIVRRLLQ